MKFTVTWTTEAENTLCELFMAISEPGEFSRLVNEIERELGRNPEHVGESRNGQLRVVMQDHVGILFEINAVDRTVNVIHIGWLK